MKATRAAATALVLLMISPTSVAASPFVAESLFLSGSTTLDGDLGALFLIARDSDFSWDGSATSATIVRDFAEYAAVDHPTNRGSYVASSGQEWLHEEFTLGQANFRSDAVTPGGAMLIRPLGDATIAARSGGFVRVVSEVDPVVSQDETADVQSRSDTRPEIVEPISGELLNFTFSDAAYTLRGDFEIILYGPAYDVSADGATSDWRTGAYEHTRTGLAVQGRQERHTLTLLDATIHVRATEPATLFTRFPALDFSGTLQAERASGELQLGERLLSPPADGSPLFWTGSTALALAPDAGLVALAPPAGALATAGGAAAPAGPAILPLTAAGVALLALAGGAFALWRRRARADDLEVALLAMEERRWQEALAPLTRVARKRPDDAGLQIDRALCHEQTGRFVEAAKAFEKALRVSPRHAEAHFYYARTLAKMREREAGRVHLETALELDPRLVEMARSESVLKGL